MASSRNISEEGDWFFTVAESTSPGSLTYSTRSRSSTTPAPAPGNHHHRSPSLASQGLRSPISANAPLTPPPTPPFNARIAAAQCKAMDGYISFADIEGLGMPDGEGEDLVDEEAKHKGAGWLKWLPLGHANRDRSETR
ncbi:uncharacterized protein PHACADRAFT_265847 [Phanerochaete carnosa HHB-10118-sp]|uniref:Uncharacterized protein n=1 Tax=Phanerochaete carnosa (strain HHB-10118-sp) TaxID=650164 RepID=K5VR77_PHACS|nr:uncharacterized protein PHACADRAFT_265847 [Phanerochaete carnosa HHB-10118-sp]EKM49079.1 hypothetical protein PHACADRAFT_265847 [Phanerochaete carnosa HHB-10118-sp]